MTRIGRIEPCGAQGESRRRNDLRTACVGAPQKTKTGQAPIDSERARFDPCHPCPNQACFAIGSSTRGGARWDRFRGQGGSNACWDRFRSASKERSPGGAMRNGSRFRGCRFTLPLLGSNQDSPDPESGVLPVTPRGNRAFCPSSAQGADLVKYGCTRGLSTPETPGQHHCARRRRIHRTPVPFGS